MLRTGATGATAAEMDRVLGLPAAHRDEALDCAARFPGGLRRRPRLGGRKEPAAAAGPAHRQRTVRGQARAHGRGLPALPCPVLRDRRVPGGFSGRGHHQAGDRRLGEQEHGRTDQKGTRGVPTARTPSACSTRCTSPLPGRCPSTRRTPQTCPSRRRPASRLPSPPCPASRTSPSPREHGWQAVDLPYAEGFVMRLVLPDAGAPGAGAPGAADAAKALDAAAPSPTQISLPQWDHKSTFELREGLRQPRSAGHARDRDGLRRNPARPQDHAGRPVRQHHRGGEGHDCRRRDPDQRTGGERRRRRPTEIRFDRPFHYEIVHVETGLPLFMGRVADPAFAHETLLQILQGKTRRCLST